MFRIEKVNEFVNLSRLNQIIKMVVIHININEYILVIHSKGEVFRVYDINNKLAIKTFLNACEKYSDTDNKEYKEYWQGLKKQITNNNYTIIHNEDFSGVRKI